MDRPARTARATGPPPPPTRRVVRVGGRVSAPALLHRVDPVYPDPARTARVPGVVILEALVDTRGRTEFIVTVSVNFEIRS